MNDEDNIFQHSRYEHDLRCEEQQQRAFYSGVIQSAADTCAFARQVLWMLFVAALFGLFVCPPWKDWVYAVAVLCAVAAAFASYLSQGFGTAQQETAYKRARYFAIALGFANVFFLAYGTTL